MVVTRTRKRTAAQSDGGTSTVSQPGPAMMQLVYRELRQLARAQLRRMPAGGATLQPTALVHEAYLRLVKRPGKRWHGRRHFYHAAGLAMRCILLDHFRARKARKHGGGWQRTERGIQLVGEDSALALAADDLRALENALRKLERDYPGLAELVYLRFFCGCTTAEIARLFGTSVSTVERDWAFARGWLSKELAP